MSKRKFLIIPDASFGPSSGGAVTQVIVSILKEMDVLVAVFGSDVKERVIIGGVQYFPAPAFSGFANLRPRIFREAINEIFEEYQPTHVFFDGSITNKPLCYMEEAYKRNIKVEVFIFMQDFFCFKYYANDDKGPCSLCLSKGLHHVFSSKCGARKAGILKLCERYRLRLHLRKLLFKADHLITSTSEQIQFYVDFGIRMEKTIKLPLPFKDNKTQGYKCERGDYFIGIAQNRIEKGFQFIPQVLSYTKAKIILAYYDEDAVERNICNKEYMRYIQNGQLRLVAANWKNGLGELIAKSQGVIIPSIWPTTTEYGLLEALAMHKPTVTFDISAHHEYLKNRINGFISPIGNFAAMGENMDYLSSLSDNAYENVVNNVEKLYVQLSDTTGWVNFFKSI